jgi:hypothetical protein
VPDRSTMTAMGPVGRQIAAPSGTAVMVAEVVYRYRPLVSEKIIGQFLIRYTAAFNVRQRANHLIGNVGKVTPWSCNRYTA